jgi:putative alpha-1,2-mannosidase
MPFGMVKLSPDNQGERSEKFHWKAGYEYSSIMVAEHAIPLIVGAYQHGIRDYDVDQAFKAVVHAQPTSPKKHPAGGHVGNRDLGVYLKHKYVPAGQGASSNTLEYAYDDWCVAQFAKTLGRNEQYQIFTERAGYWRHLFNEESGFMQPRKANGAWLEDFDPNSFRGRWVEANAWQYTWFVPQDVRGLVDAMGRDRFITRLNKGMQRSAKHDFNAPGDDCQQVPINHGNQPSMQAAYLFNDARAPWLTQKWARAIWTSIMAMAHSTAGPATRTRARAAPGSS